MAASYSSTVDELPPQHQVFINFRGSDLRLGFVSHLVAALRKHKIHYYIDTSEDKGQHLEILLERIRMSRIALCIFSSNYTESGWCLEELTMIKECMEQGKLVAVPIFYKLEPSTVRHLRGELGDAFRDLARSDERKKKKWKEALKTISNLIGIIVHETSYETSAINEIVDNIQKVLRFISVKETDNPRDKDTNFPSGKHEAKPETSLAKPADFFDRPFTSAPVDGKVQPPQIQVFINFRGDQLRKSFLGYLVDALQRSEVNVFTDNYLHIGDNLTELFKKIEESGIAIVVFSSKYTQSKWCLEELVKINERVNLGMLKVIPVFYKVTPTHVKRLKGKFGENFRDREWEFESDEPKIKRWKEALKSVSNKFALTFDKESSALEINFVGDIVKEVLKTLQAISTMETNLKLRLG